MLSKDIEKKDADSRINNAILYGLSEGESTAMEDVKRLMNKEFFKSLNPPEQAFRLGRKGSKNRPVKLKFADEKSKWEFIKRTNSKLREDGMFCKLDVNSQIREQEFKLREAVRALKKDEEHKTQMYRIRSLTIEQKDQTSGDWLPVKPEKLEKLKLSTTV